MTSDHLLSASLFSELFQHNLVSADGRIIANDQQLRDYSTFLIRRSIDRVSSLYAERKNLVNDVEELLRLDVRTKEEDRLLKKLINELDLKIEEDGLLSMKEPREPPKRYLGPKEPKKSLFERKLEGELRRVKILKRDLRTLDEWLEQISFVIHAKYEKIRPINWREAGRRFRQRTANRMCDMENARMKLIKEHYEDYDETLKRLLNKKPASGKRATKDQKAPKDQQAPEDFAVKEESDTRYDDAADDEGNAADDEENAADKDAVTEAQHDSDTVIEPLEDEDEDEVNTDG